MATTNLQSQSLGDILVESGTGTPDHTSPRGSYYTNVSTGTLFINSTGTSSGWETLNKVAWGEMYIQDNVTTTAVTTLSWVSLTGLTWVFCCGNGTEMSTSGRLKIKSNKGGTYLVNATGTIQTQGVASAFTFFLGVSKNNADPANGFWQGCMLDGNLSATAANEDDKTLMINNAISLAVNDTLEIKVRTDSVTPDLRLESGNIFVYRIGD
jgi:hypothetical protein